MIELIKEYVTAERVTMVISVITTLLAVVKMASTMKSLKKSKETSVQEVLTSVQTTIKATATETTNEAIKNVLVPVSEQIARITPVLDTFAKILALSQENTPESRIAILELIKSLGAVAPTIIVQAKESIETEAKDEEAKKEETIAKLDELGRV